MRGPIAHVVIWPNCRGYCGIPPDSALRTKPRSVGSWQLTDASLPMNFPKQLPYPELFPLPRFSPHPKIGLNGHNEDPALLLQLGQFKGHSSSRDPHEIDWRFYYNYITVHHLISSSAQFSSMPHRYWTPRVLTSWIQVSDSQNKGKSKNNTKQQKPQHLMFYFPGSLMYIFPMDLDIQPSYALLVSIWVVSVSLVNWPSWFLSS